MTIDDKELTRLEGIVAATHEAWDNATKIVWALDDAASLALYGSAQYERIRCALTIARSQERTAREAWYQATRDKTDYLLRKVERSLCIGVMWHQRGVDRRRR